MFHGENEKSFLAETLMTCRVFPTVEACLSFEKLKKYSEL